MAEQKEMHDRIEGQDEPFEIENDIQEFEAVGDGYIRSTVVGLEYADNDETEFYLQYETPEGIYTTNTKYDKPYSWDSSNPIVRLTKFNDISKGEFADIIGAEIHIKKSGKNWSWKTKYSRLDKWKGSFEVPQPQFSLEMVMAIFFLLAWMTFMVDVTF